MASNLTICEVDQDVKTKSKKFRLRKEKNTAAIVMKIDTEAMKVIVDEEFEDITIEELAEELPSHLPRYVLYSYVFKHDDGRVSYPMVFIYISPQGCKPELQMMYSGTKLHVVKEVDATKVFELRSIEDLTEEWLLEKLRFF